MKLPSDIRPADIERYDKREARVKFLRQALVDRLPFAVVFGEQHSPHKTLLLTVDEAAERLLLERLVHPAVETALLHQGKATLFSDHEGVRLWFTLDPVTVHNEGRDTYYAAPLPATLYRHLRREHYRVALPKSLPAHVTLSLPTHVVRAPLADISVGGVRACLSGNVVDQFSHGQTFTQGSVSVGTDLALSCDLRVCTTQYRARGDCTEVGLKFDGLGASAERALSRFIITLQARAKTP